MDRTEKLAYTKGYNAGIVGRWPAHRPPAPPDNLVRGLLDAVMDLRDAADTICAQLDEADDFVKSLGPCIDAVDEANRMIVEWLRTAA